jgi:hypothetical protein
VSKVLGISVEVHHQPIALSLSSFLFVDFTFFFLIKNIVENVFVLVAEKHTWNLVVDL